MAICVNEVLDKLGCSVFWGVVGIDISPTALAVARQAIYTRRRVNMLEPALKHKYFTPAGKDYQVMPSLRQRACFVQANVVESGQLPLMPVDVVFCQNMLIYFPRWRQEKVLDAIVKRLKVGGLLVVAPGEASGWRHPKMQRISDTSGQGYVRLADTE